MINIIVTQKTLNTLLYSIAFQKPLTSKFYDIRFQKFN